MSLLVPEGCDAAEEFATTKLKGFVMDELTYANKVDFDDLDGLVVCVGRVGPGCVGSVFSRQASACRAHAEHMPSACRAHATRAAG